MRSDKKKISKRISKLKTVLDFNLRLLPSEVIMWHSSGLLPDTAVIIPWQTSFIVSKLKSLKKCAKCETGYNSTNYISSHLHKTFLLKQSDPEGKSISPTLWLMQKKWTWSQSCSSVQGFIWCTLTKGLDAQLWAIVNFLLCTCM